MSENKVPQQTLLKCRKMRHPTDGSKRWQVEGPAGTVTYDLLGNHLHFLDRNGEHDSGGRRYADQIRAVAEAGDDHGVIDLLAGHYRTVLAGHPYEQPEPGSVVARALAALAAFGVTTEREAESMLPMWAGYVEMTADDRTAVYRHYRNGGAS